MGGISNKFEKIMDRMLNFVKTRTIGIKKTVCFTLLHYAIFLEKVP
jgi:hypothetical protein